MKSISKKAMEVIAKIGMNTAVKAAGATSFLWMPSAKRTKDAERNEVIFVPEY